jgi:hypothetical protein
MMRTGHTSRSVRALGALLLGLLLFSTQARTQEWYEFYDQGLEAINAGRWGDAVRELGRAIALREEPGANVKTYGLQFIDYFPYTYRGMALYRSGNYDGALEDLVRANRFGAAFEGRADGNAAKILREYLALAQQHKVDSETFAAAVEAYRGKDYRSALDSFKTIGTNSSFYAEAQRYITLTEGELRKPPPATAQGPAVDKEQEKPAVVAAKPPAPPATDSEFKEGVRLFGAKDYAGAEAKFRAVLAKDRAHREAADYLRRTQAERAKQSLAQQRPSKPAPARTSPAQEPEPAAIGAQEQSVDSLVAIAVALYEDGLLERSEQTFGRVRKLSPSQADAAFYLEKISANRQSIRDGVVAYFEGEYEAAISRLSDAARLNKESAVLYGYLAAACAARFYLTGAEDKDLRDRARTAFRTARQLDATYTPDQRYTSPRIISMLNSPQDTQ